MREAFALLRADWVAALSYRVKMIISLVGLLATVVPVYFVAGALQPVMEESIRTQGGEYFGFVLIGLVVFSLLAVAVNALPRALSRGISTGTLEALLSTRASLPAILAGLISYRFLWTLVRAMVLVLAAAALGAYFAWDRTLVALAVVGLIVLSYIPFGLMGGALVLAFRTSGPLGRAVLTISALLGGVYYPAQVVPSWLQYVSDLIPLTYGLRALRRIILEDMPLSAVAADLGILAAATVALLTVGGFAFAGALAYARRSGTLAQY